MLHSVYTPDDVKFMVYPIDTYKYALYCFLDEVLVQVHFIETRNYAAWTITDKSEATAHIGDSLSNCVFAYPLLRECADAEVYPVTAFNWSDQDEFDAWIEDRKEFFRRVDQQRFLPHVWLIFPEMVEPNPVDLTPRPEDDIPF